MALCVFHFCTYVVQHFRTENDDVISSPLTTGSAKSGDCKYKNTGHAFAPEGT